MKKYYTNIILAALLVAGLLLAGIWFKRKTVPPEMAFSTARLITLDENTFISIDDFRDSVVIISCFQTWCRDCAKETPILNALATKLKSTPFKVIYITDERNEKLSAFRARLPSDRILFTMTEQKLADFGIHVYPTTYLLNKKGEVVKTKLEGHNWLEEESLIRGLLTQ